MNILHLLTQDDSYDTVVGVIDLAKQLIANGHDCIIASSRSLASLEYDTNGLVYETLTSPGRRPWQLGKDYATIKKIIKKHHIEVIHAHSPLTSWIALFVARAEDVCFVTTGADFYTHNLLHESIVLGKAILVHHEALAAHLAETFQLSRERMRFIKQGLDLGMFEFRSPDARSKTEFTLVLPWSLRPHMGYESFLKGMVKATRIIPHMQILIADNMPQSNYSYKKDLALFIRRLGLSRHAVFFDAARFDLSAIAHATIVVSPFIKETPCTRPLLEAFAYGTPVIATRVAGTAELIEHNMTGILVPPNDHDAFTKAVIQLLRDFGIQRTIASAARSNVEAKHSITQRADDFIDVYQRAIRHKKILVINLGSIGEVAWSVPALRVLKRKMADTHITNLSHSSLRSLFVHCPYVDELLACGFFRRKKNILDFVRIVRIVLRGRFDIVVDFTNTLSSRFLCFVSFAMKRYSAHHPIREILPFRRTQNVDAFVSPMRQRLLIIRPLVAVEPKEQTIEFWPSPDDSAFVARLLKEHWVGKTKLIGLDISSSARFLKNGTSLEHFAYLCDTLADCDMRVVLTGLHVDAATIAALVGRIRSKPICAAGALSLMQFIALIQRCDLYIGSNEELLHLARALRIPLLILSATKRTHRLLSVYGEANSIAFLTNAEMQSAMRRRRKRRYGSDGAYGNIVVDKINQLIKKQ